MLMGELLFGYLVHHAYWDTAAAVARDMLEGAAEVRMSATSGTCLVEKLLQLHQQLLHQVQTELQTGAPDIQLQRFPCSS